MNGDPWERRGWFSARLLELIWTSLGTVPFSFWMVTGTILALALNALYLVLQGHPERVAPIVAIISALMPLDLGLAAAYTARRLGDKGIDAKFGGNGNGVDAAIFQPGRDDPTS